MNLPSNAPVSVDPQQRRQIRRTALLLGLVALALYVSFIVYSVLHGLHSHR